MRALKIILMALAFLSLHAHAKDGSAWQGNRSEHMLRGGSLASYLRANARLNVPGAVFRIVYTMSGSVWPECCRSLAG